MGFSLNQVPFRCPNCSASLEPVDGGLVCVAGHRFDRAREGYVNLLPGGRLKGREPGDNAEMIAARRAVFDAGHYRRVMSAVAAAVDAGSPVHVIDAGCGEGSYLAMIGAPDRVGIDVSKPAVKAAARRHRDCRFAVASSFHLPVADASIDAVVSVFAPRPFDEFRRAVRPGGIAVLASPGPDHFAGLTDIIYATPEPHDTRPHAVEASVVTSVRYELTLEQPDLINLATMTPYWWKMTADQQADLAACRELTVLIDIVVSTHCF